MFPVYNIVYPVFKNRQDANEIAFLKKSIRPGFQILDIGANIGFYTKILSASTGANGKVHSFEPDSVNFRHLQGNTRHLQNVVLNQRAVSDKTSSLKMYKSKDLNVDHRTYPVGEYESIENIEAVSVDDYVNGQFRVDLIKMDIQGFEVSALKGMEQTIRNNPDIIMLLELWPYGLHAAGSSVGELYSVVQGLGLHIQFLENGQLNRFEEKAVKECEDWGWGTYKNIVLSVHKPSF